MRFIGMMAELLLGKSLGNGQNWGQFSSPCFGGFMRYVVDFVFLGIASVLFIWHNGSEKTQTDQAKYQLMLTERRLAETEAKLAAKPAHNYSRYTSGEREWRFDPESGDSCILLTTDSDWKKASTKKQSCACEDARHDYQAIPSADRNQADRDWVFDTCGITRKAKEQP